MQAEASKVTLSFYMLALVAIASVLALATVVSIVFVRCVRSRPVPSRIPTTPVSSSSSPATPLKSVLRTDTSAPTTVRTHKSVSFRRAAQRRLIPAFEPASRLARSLSFDGPEEDVN